MAGTQNNYYIEANDSAQGYDILKRDGVINPDGTKSPERICTIYSMEYLQPVLSTLRDVDGVVSQDDENFMHRSPVRES